MQATHFPKGEEYVVLGTCEGGKSSGMLPEQPKAVPKKGNMVVIVRLVLQEDGTVLPTVILKKAFSRRVNAVCVCW